MPTHSAEALAAALMRLPARQLQVLSARLLSGPEVTRASAATHWGIAPAAADVLLLRAARALEAAANASAPPFPPAFGIEATQATQLAAALGRAAGPAPAEPEALSADVTGLAGLLAALRDQAEEVNALMRAAEARAAASPGRAIENWARRLGIALVLGLTLFFWQRERQREHAHEREPGQMRVEPRTPIHAP